MVHARAYIYTHTCGRTTYICLCVCIYREIIIMCVYIHLYMYTYTQTDYNYVCVYTYIQVYICVLCVGVHIYVYTHEHTQHSYVRVYLYIQIDMGWLRSVGSIKLQVPFAEYRLFYRSLLLKRPIILRSLLIVATPWCAGLAV